MGWGTPAERFKAKVEDGENGCWQWIGGKKAAGYGQFSVDGRKTIAHRWAYSYYVAAIPDGYEIDHLCSNRSCVNPAHLEAVPLDVNRERRNARKTHCINGHEFTPDNTALWTDDEGYVSRRCRICARAALRRLEARRRAARDGAR